METYDVKRIIVCVDGTWYNEDGKEGYDNGNTSNVFRIFACVSQGIVEQDGVRVKQVAKYFQGLGTKKKITAKYKSGIFGQGCDELIKEVYKYCCKEVNSDKDELWFFGFSRGAYIVRAVADMFESMHTLVRQETGQFESNWRRSIGFLRNRAAAKPERSREYGELFHFMSKNTCEKPVIQFMGLFDTVKSVKGVRDIESSFPASIQRIRHALAMNETRTDWHPMLFTPDPTDRLANQSLIQAWFAGSHSDIGGGTQDDGLSLYPLQWMLVECRKHGLALSHNPEKRLVGLIQNPLTLVLPNPSEDQDQNGEKAGGSSAKGRKSLILDTPRLGSLRTHSSDSRSESLGLPHMAKKEEWNFTYNNGVNVTMYDLRATHNHGNLQKWQRNRLKKRGIVEDATHRVKLNTGTSIPFRGGDRKVFDDDNGVLGYRKDESFGTVVHPSVYFILETYASLGFGDALKGFQMGLYRARQTFQSAEHGRIFPWLLERDFSPRFGQFRILICGQSGVGKSTLLNRIFGVPMSETSSIERGRHDIETAFESDQYPGLIIHDSEGFEPGETKRMAAFGDFLKKRSYKAAPENQLHAVWICIEMATARPVLASLELALEAISKHAPNIPVCIVGTKKDQCLLLSKRMSSERIWALESGQGSEQEQEVNRKLCQDTQKLWQERLNSQCPEAVEDLDISFAFVSQDDFESIRTLMQLTLQPLSSEGARFGMVSAQIVDTDLKIDLAVAETVRLLRTAVKTASGLVFLSAYKTPSYSFLVCQTIVRCFGLTTDKNLKRETEVDRIMKEVVWGNVRSFMAQSLSQTMIIGGGVVALSIFTGFGGIPLAATLPLLEAPAAARMVTKCACDLMIIIDRAFQFSSKQATGSDIRWAALEYLQHGGGSSRRKVHREINSAIPALSKLAIDVYKQEKMDNLQSKIVKIVMDHRIRDAERQAVTAADQDLPHELVVEEDAEDLAELADMESEVIASLRDNGPQGNGHQGVRHEVHSTSAAVELPTDAHEPR